jgi:NYN domain
MTSQLSYHPASIQQYGQTLTLVDGACLAHCQKYQQFEPISLIKRLSPDARCIYYSYASGSAPAPDRLVSCGIAPVVVDPHWNTTGRPKGLAPRMLPDLLLYGEDYRLVILVSASGDFAPAVRALNQRGKTCVKVAAFSSCPISKPLLDTAGEIIDLCKLSTNYSHASLT